MKRGWLIALFMMLALGAVFAYPGLGKLGMDQRAIVRIFEIYCETQNAADTEGWIALWDVDGIQLAPGAPMSVGKAEIWKNNKDGFGGGEMKFNIVQQEIVVSGWYGYIRGVYDYVFTPTGGASMAFKGKYLTVFRKQFDGSWLIYRDTFNSDAP